VDGTVDAAAEAAADAAAAADPAAARERAKDLLSEAKKLKRQGRRDAAVAKLFEASRVDRRYAPIWDALRDLHFQIGAYEEAAQYGTKALRLAPGNGQYHLRVGEAFWKLHRYPEAEQAWKTAQSLGVAQADERLQALRQSQGR
jgi:tetratricopeptide (TPR) repeat protein